MLKLLGEMIMFNKVKTFCIEVKDILKLLIMSSKTNTLFLIITNIISGLMIPLGIMVWKYFCLLYPYDAAEE